MRCCQTTDWRSNAALVVLGRMWTREAEELTDWDWFPRHRADGPHLLPTTEPRRSTQGGTTGVIRQIDSSHCPRGKCQESVNQLITLERILRSQECAQMSMVETTYYWIST